MVLKTLKLVILFCASIFYFSFYSNAQEVKIELGPDKISANELYTVTISIENDKIISYDNFPEIPGFTKRGTSSSSSMKIINGQRSSSHSIVQNYMPSGEGEYTLKPFYMNINGEVYSSPGKKIVVGPPLQAQRRQGYYNNDPFEDFFGREEEQEFIEVEDNAFLALSTDKEQVYVGEGFNVVLALYVADDNRALLNFYDLGRQLSEILKKIKPANCWEENFNIDNITGNQVTLNNKNYQQYKIYQASYFPLNTETVKFPSVGLEMIKYKEAKRRHFFGQNRREDFKTYYSKQKEVKVVPLPAHPLRDKVAVGVYKLDEKISAKELQTGESFNYEFVISGEGNIAGIEPPTMPTGKDIEFYPPNTDLSINRNYSRVAGKKTFSYFGIPNEPGTYNLDNFFNWVYFNPRSHQYDTLRPSLAINVQGESKKNEYILSHDLGAFYDIISLENNELKSRHHDDFIKMFVNIFILGMLVLTAVFIFRK